MKEPTLFEMPEGKIPHKILEGTGVIRSYSGTVMECILKEALHLLPGIQNGKALVCPDAFSPNATRRPVEIKSLKRKSKLVIYKWRLEKDHKDTIFIIGVYKRKIGAKSLLDIWEGFSRCLERVLILSYADIVTATEGEELHKIKKHTTASGSRNGYQRKGYKEGYYSIPYAKLIPDLLELPFKAGCTLFGLPFSFSISISQHALQLSQST